MEKENLILIHSFPTNSVLLKGLIDYLNDYFKVYFIDLPGFTKQVPPFSRITFEAFFQFVEEKVKSFDLDHFIAGGISFGFTIVNHLDYDNKCKGIIAIEPFMGSDSLRMSPSKKALYNFAVQVFCSLRLYKLFWGKGLLRNQLPKIRHYPPETMNIMFDEIDGRTFFETANLILKTRNQYRFHDLPYVLVANPEDRTVNYDYLYKTMKAHIKKLLVIHTQIDHYPRDTSKEYFKRMVPEEIFENMVRFLANPQEP